MIGRHKDSYKIKLPYLLVPSDPMGKMKKSADLSLFSSESIQQVLGNHLVYQELGNILITEGLQEAHQKLQQEPRTVKYQVSGPRGYQQGLGTCSHHHLHLSRAQESHFDPVWAHPSLIQWCCHKCQSVREWAACTVPWQLAGRAGKNCIPQMLCASNGCWTPVHSSSSPEMAPLFCHSHYEVSENAQLMSTSWCSAVPL